MTTRWGHSLYLEGVQNRDIGLQALFGGGSWAEQRQDHVRDLHLQQTGSSALVRA